MSCLGPCYTPNPPRAWSRVQGQCSYAPIDPNATEVFIPLLNRSVSLLEAFYFEQLLAKGNVLQYKNNAANWSRAQNYSKIVRRENASRSTWGTQSDRFTDPNTKFLKRIGAINITTDGIQTGDPITCTKIPPLPINNVIPPNISNNGGPEAPVVPPPPPDNQPGSGNILPVVPDSTPNEDEEVIQDGGVLLCNVQENPCTGQTIEKPGRSRWNPTSDSDVPGRIQELYWDPRLQTWIPRQRLNMSNSLDKWPVNAVLFNGFGDCSLICNNSGVSDLQVSDIESTSALLTWQIPNASCYIEDIIITIEEV